MSDLNSSANTGFTVRVTNGAQIADRLQALEKQFKREFREALTEEALAIFVESQNQTPVDQGNLIGSGVVGEVPNVGGGAKSVIAYGTHYALPVHERVEVKHEVGKAKFLEDPFNEAQEGMVERMEQRVASKVF